MAVSSTGEIEPVTAARQVSIAVRMANSGILEGVDSEELDLKATNGVDSEFFREAAVALATGFEFDSLLGDLCVWVDGQELRSRKGRVSSDTDVARNLGHWVDGDTIYMEPGEMVVRTRHHRNFEVMAALLEGGVDVYYPENLFDYLDDRVDNYLSYDGHGTLVDLRESFGHLVKSFAEPVPLRDGERDEDYFIQEAASEYLDNPAIATYDADYIDNGHGVLSLPPEFLYRLAKD